MSRTECDLCGAKAGVKEYRVEPKDEYITICSKCSSLLDEPTKDKNHWYCLNETMWSQEPPVQVVIYRTLTKLGSQDLLDMMYLEPEVLEWAKQGLSEEQSEPTRDSNGNILSEGDSVTIIKDLVVKGAGFTAKQGTTVKNIKLVPDDPTHIKGRVNGTEIFILSKFLKRL
jgi:protein PhnA